MTLAPILSNLINKSLAQGLFPQSLKRAKIFTIFKSKDKLNITNYRPISILPNISKVYEKVFQSRLYVDFVQIIYYPHNLALHQEQARNILY